MTTEMVENEVESAWREHCRSAVRKFVINAVVVDDKPFLPERNPSVQRSAATAQAADEVATLSRTHKLRHYSRQWRCVP